MHQSNAISKWPPSGSVCPWCGDGDHRSGLHRSVPMFAQFFKSVFLAIVCASSSLAFTAPTNSKHATHRVRSIANNVKLETFHPVSTYEYGNRPRFAQAGFSNDSVAAQAAPVLIVNIQNGIFVSDAVSNVTFNSDGLVVAVGFLRQAHITYRYGFTEKAFSFQKNKFGLGGK
ncbi:hypothetical protein B0H19DRAFT_1373155 [Mycena capillaripes]|nr:hypothetical protein B0H19DRAFT_1373155 [Mycena capillaripes]